MYDAPPPMQVGAHAHAVRVLRDSEMRTNRRASRGGGEASEGAAGCKNAIIVATRGQQGGQDL